MKISKLLNKNYLTIIIISIFFLINPLNAEDEPIDIWENQENQSEQNSQIDNNKDITINEVDIK